jgi:hypothetical protein
MYNLTTLLIGDCGPIFRAWQKASTELSTDSFKSILAPTPPQCLERDTRKRAISRRLRRCPRNLITSRLSRKLRMAPRGPLVEDTAYSRSKIDQFKP